MIVKPTIYLFSYIDESMLILEDFKIIQHPVDEDIEIKVEPIRLTGFQDGTYFMFVVFIEDEYYRFNAYPKTRLFVQNNSLRGRFINVKLNEEQARLWGTEGMIKGFAGIKETPFILEDMKLLLSDGR